MFLLFYYIFRVQGRGALVIRDPYWGAVLLLGALEYSALIKVPTVLKSVFFQIFHLTAVES